MYVLQIALTPAEPECKTTDIRLVNSRRREVELAIRGDGSVKEGRVEICINGLWSSVCDNGWDSLDAKVVCRQMNLTSDCELEKRCGYYSYTNCTSADARAFYRNQDIFFLYVRRTLHYNAKIQCTGSETHLVNCSSGYHTSTCSRGVGVICPSGEQDHKNCKSCIMSVYIQNHNVYRT